MNLPSFLWLWRIAAWSMGFSIFIYILLALSGLWMWQKRTSQLTDHHQQLLLMVEEGQRARIDIFSFVPRSSLRLFHYILGTILVFLVLLLLGVGLIGTIGYYGSIGHSLHLLAGLSVVSLVLISAVSSTQINANLLARKIHITCNCLLFFGFVFVSLTGWNVVQKYLP